MKKVFLRLIVAAVIVALVAVVLMNTVFKTESSLKTHNVIASSLSANGEITRLNKMFQDANVEEQFKKEVDAVNFEINTLSHLYTKIIVTKKNSDSKTKTMLSSLEKLEKSLNNANEKYKKIEKSNVPNDSELKIAMVNDLKDELNASIEDLTNLNLCLIEYLIEYYYNNNYDTDIMLNYIKVAYAKNYFTTKSEADYNLFKKLNDVCSNDAKKIDLSKLLSFNNSLYYAKDVNVYKLLTDEHYIEGLNHDNQIKANLILSCIQEDVLV